MRSVYTLLFFLALPGIWLRLLWKSRRLPGYRQRIGERFAIYPKGKAPSQSVLWVHAVSVGECEAAFPLIKRLLELPEPPRVLMTATTPTGSSRIQTVLGSQVDHVYLPYDLPFLVERFLNRFQPQLAVIMETEIWPNLFTACRQRGVPLMIINGRLSDRSTRGYSRLMTLIAPALQSARRILVQSDEDALRYQSLGAHEDSVIVCGNLKYDLHWDDTMVLASQSLRRDLFEQRPVIVAGSTHYGEEAPLLEAFLKLRVTHPTAVLVLAPRHPERSAEIFKLIRSQGLPVLCRSSSDSFTADHAVLLIDGIGELRRFYGTADVAYIGGSLISHGGQNPLEPLIQGIPVIFGPSMENFREAREKILNVGAGIEISDVESLHTAWLTLLSNPKEALRRGSAGRRLIEDNRGALSRTLDQITQLWPKAAAHASFRGLS